MGRMKKKSSVPLSLFYLKYFAYIFHFMLLMTTILLIAFNMLMNSDIVYPANYAQEQAMSSYDTIQKADKVTEDLIPDLCDYAVFDLNGNIQNGNLKEDSAQQAWNAVLNGKDKIGKYSYTVISRNTEYCVLRYTLVPQYKSLALQKFFVHPQMLIFISAIWGILLVIVVVAIRFGKVLNRKLSVLIHVTKKVEQQELDFEISTSGIKEIDAVLNSMDNMRVALKESLEQQWHIEQEKNRQMSALAHDLKTPLTLVRGNAELLLESNLSETQRKYTEYIENSSLQMQNYVQTLIEVTKSWQGYQFRPQKVDFSMLLQEIKGQINGLCQINNLVLDWTCNGTINEILIDHDLFIRAVTNVVSNAVEHSPAEGVISFSVTEQSDFLTFAVSDSGKGFSAEALKHGTEQFYMDDSSRNSKIHFGIGLYAANSIIQKHGGHLILENSPQNGGGKVTIKIPY